MAFSTYLNRATERITTTGDLQTAVRSAFTTFQAAIETVQYTYGTPDAERIDFNDKLIDMARNLDAQLQ